MKKSLCKIIASVISLSCIGVPYISYTAEQSGLTVQAIEQDRELSGFSVYSKDYKTSKNLEYTVPLGYDFTIDDVENLVFRKTYEVSHINIDGEKIIDYYDNEYLTMEEIQKECEITTKFQYKSENQKHFIVGLKYIGDEVESVLINSLFVTVTYDTNDLSCYGDNVLTSETVLAVDDADADYSGYYLFNNGSEKFEEIEQLGVEERPYIIVTEDNNKFLLDSGAFYVQAEYNFKYHMWVYNKIKKTDTVTSTLYGWVDSIDNEDNAFIVSVNTDNGMKNVEYPINADYVYIPEDLDTGNHVTIIGYNVTADDWYINPYQLFVEPSHKVTISGKITKIVGNTVYAEFIGCGELHYYVAGADKFSEGDTLFIKNYGDCIDEEWLASPMEVWIEKSTADTAEETKEIVYGDANCDEVIDVVDITALKKHIVKLSELSENGIKNCDFFGDGEITVKNLGQIIKYSIKVIDNLEFVNE